MRPEIVNFFTEREEKFANILIEVGTKKNVARVLVFLAGTPEANYREIERGTDMHQSEVSKAMKYMMGKGWVNCHKRPSKSKSKEIKIFKLAISIEEIVNNIEKDKKNMVNNQLTLMSKIRECRG